MRSTTCGEESTNRLLIHEANSQATDHQVKSMENRGNPYEAPVTGPQQTTSRAARDKLYTKACTFVRAHCWHY